MKRFKLIIFLGLIALLAITTVALIACDNNPPTPPADKTISGVTFDNLTVDYDGNEHELTVKGTLPEGANVAYTSNKATNAGVYNATATVTCEGYKTLTLNATLTINKINYDMSGITWDYSQEFTYDGTAKAVALQGQLPDGVTVKAYTDNSKTDTGTYTASVTFNYDEVNHNAPSVANCVWTIKGKDFEGLSLDDLTVVYNQQEHEILVSGTLPEGANVAYVSNKATDAGVYNATATITCKGYNALTLTATLTIDKADISAVITLSNSTVEYDGLPHSIQVVGNVPAGVTATYYYNNVQTYEVTDVGEYTVRCVLGGKNYNDKEMTPAKLTIKSTEKQLYSVVTANGKIYFQNDLDGEKLYTVSGSGVSKVSNDVPNYMIANGSNIYYYSTSLFSKVIKSYDGSEVAPLYSTKGEYLTTDGMYIYYAINNLLLNTDQNGIYRIKLDGTDAEPTRLTTDKAAYLTNVGGYIYYTNKSDGDKLYRVSASANNAQGTQLRTNKGDEKVSYIITDGTNLYFNSTKAAFGLVGYAAAVCKYNPASNTEVKLTTDAGKYLTKVGSYIYYVNNDKITSNLFGDGIYKVSALQTSDSNASGTKVLSIENNGYSSLTSDGTNLYYYKLNDKHFYKNSTDGNSEVDLMRNFQPVDDTVLVDYSQVAQYNGEIYYTNPLDYSCLYKYNPATRAKFKVLADSVSNVSFYSYGGVDYMYYSTYIFTNYALFRMDLATGETEKVTSKRVDNLIFEDDKIYCVRVTVGNNNIIRMDLDGANEEVLYKGNNDSPDTTRLYKIDNTFYFVMNPQGGFRNVSTFTIGDKNKVNLHKAFNFVIVNNKIYYYADVKDSSSWTNPSGIPEKALKVCDMDGKNETTLVSNVDITYMYTDGSKIYYSSKSSQNTGVYVYDIAKNTTTKISDKPAHGMTMLDGKLYFLQSQVSYTDDYPTQSQACDGHLYCYDGEKVTKVA